MWEWVYVCSICVSRCVQLYGNVLLYIYVCAHACLCVCECVFVERICICVCTAEKWETNLETWSQTWEAPIWAWFTEQGVHFVAFGGMGQIARQWRARAREPCRRQGSIGFKARWKEGRSDPGKTGAVRVGWMEGFHTAWEGRTSYWRSEIENTFQTVGSWGKEELMLSPSCAAESLGKHGAAQWVYKSEAYGKSQGQVAN